MSIRRALPIVVASALASLPALADFSMDLGRGEVKVEEPAAYDPLEPTPLIVLLHGYGSDGAEQDAYLGFGALVDEFGFFYMYPDGLLDDGGSRFWNATDACCDFYRTNVDDSAYIRGLIEEVKSLRNIDPRRIFLVGHSNGGFMTHRMACDHAEIIAAVANLAGSTWKDPARCDASQPVHSLRIHGTLDTIIRFKGGYIEDAGPYPGAVASSIDWGTFLGCARVVDDSADRMNLDWLVPGRETHIYKVEKNCDLGGSVELWEMRRSWHVPLVTRLFARRVVEYFYSHPKPQ